jgi:hypothetical protein
MNNAPEEKVKGDLLKNVGIFAIEDFDVAMKSKLPAEYFKRYIIQHSPDYANVISKSLLNQSHQNGKAIDLKLGEIFFTLFQLMKIHDLKLSHKYK